MYCPTSQLSRFAALTPHKALGSLTMSSLHQQSEVIPVNRPSGLNGVIVQKDIKDNSVNIAYLVTTMRIIMAHSIAVSPANVMVMPTPVMSNPDNASANTTLTDIIVNHVPGKLKKYPTSFSIKISKFLSSGKTHQSLFSVLVF